MDDLSFDFEQITIPELGDGVLFTGFATLTDNDGDGFRVKDICLGKRNWLSRPPYDHGGTLEQRLFAAIAKVIENDRMANGEWADHAEAWRHSVGEAA